MITKYDFKFGYEVEHELRLRYETELATLKSEVAHLTAENAELKEKKIRLLAGIDELDKARGFFVSDISDLRRQLRIEERAHERTITALLDGSRNSTRIMNMNRIIAASEAAQRGE